MFRDTGHSFGYVGPGASPEFKGSHQPTQDLCPSHCVLARRRDALPAALRGFAKVGVGTLDEPKMSTRLAL